MISATQKAIITIDQHYFQVVYITFAGFFNITCQLTRLSIISNPMLRIAAAFLSSSNAESLFTEHTYPGIVDNSGSWNCCCHNIDDRYLQYSVLFLRFSAIWPGQQSLLFYLLLQNDSSREERLLIIRARLVTAAEPLPSSLAPGASFSRSITLGACCPGDH